MNYVKWIAYSFFAAFIVYAFAGMRGGVFASGLFTPFGFLTLGLFMAGEFGTAFYALDFAKKNKAQE